MAIFGTDSGPPCRHCDARLWTYDVGPWDHWAGPTVKATCATCRRTQTFVGPMADPMTVQDVRERHVRLEVGRMVRLRFEGCYHDGRQWCGPRYEQAAEYERAILEGK